MEAKTYDYEGTYATSYDPPNMATVTCPASDDLDAVMATLRAQAELVLGPNCDLISCILF